VRYGNIQGTSREIRKVSRRYSTVERTRRRYRRIREKDNRDLWQTQGDPGMFSWIQRDLGRYPTVEIPEEIQGDPETTLGNSEAIQGDPCDTGESERDTGYPEKIQGDAE
jgi:hypothetical protein